MAAVRATWPRLAELRPGLRVVGVDISADMVRLVFPAGGRLAPRRQTALRAGRRRQPLGFPYASFEAAELHLHHWRRPERSWRSRAGAKPGQASRCSADFDRDTPGAAVAASARRYGPKMYLLHAAKRFEPFYGAAALGRLLEASPFQPWRDRAAGVYSGRSQKAGGLQGSTGPSCEVFL